MNVEAFVERLGSGRRRPHAHGRQLESPCLRVRRSRLRRGTRRVRAQLRRARRDRRCRRGVLARREGRRPVGWPSHARGRRAVERRHADRLHVQHQGPGCDDACAGELAWLARLRRTGRALLARVRAERQGRRDRAPAARPRGGAGLARRGAADRADARPRCRRTCARAAETSLAARHAPRLPHDVARAVHAGADPPRRPRAPHARALLPRGNRGAARPRVLHRSAARDPRRAPGHGQDALHRACASGRCPGRLRRC